MELMYLDHAATTPLHPQVLEAMMPYLTENFGNPSSIHHFGRAARSAIHRSRDAMAELLGCHPSELIFTSGGTESNNAALFGVIFAEQDKLGKHVITTQMEHHAILHPAEQLEKLGVEVTYVPVDREGLVHPEHIEAAIRPGTVLISVMMVNNEVGTIQPIKEIGELARRHGIYIHVDAVQALGKLDLNLSEIPVDLMSFSGHKIYGPKGIGLLYAAKGTKFSPLLTGGAQERNKRAGTEHVAGIVGFAEALKLISEKRASFWSSCEDFRKVMTDHFLRELSSDGFVENGHSVQRVPHILNVSFPGIETETLLMNLDLEGIAASSGSACSSGSLELSHVLRAMDLPETVMGSAVRFSFGLGNSIENIHTAAQKTATIVKRIRK
ncbi:cysteine desulfurase family protein [Paenibacillus larvae]